MNATRSARDYIEALCYGTLYERLAAAADIGEDVTRTGAEWNDFVAILSVLGDDAMRPVQVPPIDTRALQRRLLERYERHPLLRRDASLVDLLSTVGAAELSALVSTSSAQETFGQARYIDAVRRELGLLVNVALPAPLAY